jgi:excisionase family DNA binding protein
MTRTESAFPHRQPTAFANQVIIEPAPDRFAYRVSDACVALGIGRTSFYELVKSGQLKLIKIAGRTLVPRSELERLTRVD